jgi:2-polyprenyl-3-methyl-5-hydroxy-6-metoxy-1,4-benzoquinol methylase
MNVVTACPVCGSCDERPPVVHLRYGAIRTCGRCGCGILEPRPTQGGLRALHSDETYYKHPYFEQRRDANAAMRRMSERRLRDIERLVGPLREKRLLDVGCDTGVFVEFATAKGMSAIGIDVFDRVIEIGRAQGRDLRVGTLEAAGIADQSVDVVTGFDLIEHVDDPVGFVKNVARVLRPGGVVALETPNYEGLIYRLGRILDKFSGKAALSAVQERLWPPFHVQYFTAPALARLLAETGLEEVEVRGREMDADELMLAQPVLRLAVRSVFATGRTFGMPTLLTAFARKR